MLRFPSLGVGHLTHPASQVGWFAQEYHRHVGFAGGPDIAQGVALGNEVHLDGVAKFVPDGDATRHEL